MDTFYFIVLKNYLAKSDNFKILYMSEILFICETHAKSDK